MKIPEDVGEAIMSGAFAGAIEFGMSEEWAANFAVDLRERLEFTAQPERGIVEEQQ